jgi:hypothetical protein
MFASLLLPKWSQCYQFGDSVSKVETPQNANLALPMSDYPTSPKSDSESLLTDTLAKGAYLGACFDE